MSSQASDLDTTYDHHVEVICRTLQRLPAFRKVAVQKLQSFALHLALVALSVRTGCLFGGFAVDQRIGPSRAFEQLIQELREALSSFRHVVIFTDPDGTDFFFVNIVLLLQRLEQDDLPASVLLEGQTATLMSAPPESVRTRLNEWLNVLRALQRSADPHPSSLVTFIQDDSPTERVPLAAVLIEYPVAYVPGEGQSGPFLSNVDLSVFICSLAQGAGGAPQTLGPGHTLLQFSCPCSLVQDVGDIAGQLERRFSSRLAAAGVPYPLQVSRRTERLERVAL